MKEFHFSWNEIPIVMEIKGLGFELEDFEFQKFMAKNQKKSIPGEDGWVVRMAFFRTV